ncbi:MAG: tRNA (adenosine(37)-N6)-dimethylallyltransferase MiaA [Calditrichaeota bacterium]|nr:tRNA (adenosine(37)-N6)-dimethylallyltransferase MiaA [Calditrichota bacterium]MCB9391923.1 tRNA (adenosine(37)-N6)-dimethylallyltransferase MiaA [Calditrichota bacterium]
MDARDSLSPKLLILAGTTASGKTEVSIPLAEQLGGEIVNADSRQVYRELRIGTAPPNEEEQARVTHHFVATKSLRDRWTAGDFAREARLVIAEILHRGAVPMVVGGSMLYLRALTDGLYESEDEPKIDYSELRAEWNRRGAGEMMRELESIDPEFASTTRAEDHHRVLRAIGLWRTTGQRLSELRKSGVEPINLPYRLYFLHGDRDQTYERVNHRADEMFRGGLVEEVRELMAKGFDESNCNALRTHGYQEVFPYLRGEISYDIMREEIQKAVRHYVKRQFTWFRRESRAIWVHRSFTESPDEVARRIFLDFTGTPP